MSYLRLDKNKRPLMDSVTWQVCSAVFPNKQSQFHRATKSDISLTRKETRICTLPTRLEGGNWRRLKNSQDRGCPASSLKRGQLKYFKMTAEVAGGRDEKAQLTTAVHYKETRVWSSTARAKITRYLGNYNGAELCREGRGLKGTLIMPPHQLLNNRECGILTRAC